VNLSQIESITIGVGGAGVEGKIFVDAIRTSRLETSTKPTAFIRG
jgi:hypothetical protein